MPAPTQPSPAPERGAATSRPRSVVVVGAGLAGLRTAAELRARGFTGRVTVVGAETVPPYDRPPLSKELFSRTEPRWLAHEGLGDLAALADEVLLGRRAVHLEAGADDATVVTEPVDAPGRTRSLTADAVVLAVGAVASAPPTWPGVLTLRSADDAARLRARLVPGARLVVVGAGWIGAEVAGLAAARGCPVTVVEAAPTPLHAQLGPAVGALTAPWYADAGVELRCGRPVAAVRDGTVVLAATADSAAEEVAADVVLAATGARPATAWLRGSVPLTPGGAVPVDDRGRVAGGPPTVLAVGDCAEMTVPGLGSLPGGHWDAALTHPAAVVAGLLGDPVPAPPAPYVFSTQLGHELTLVGHADGGAEVVLRTDGPAVTALYVERVSADVGALVGGFTADRPRDVPALRKLLAGGSRPLVDLRLAGDPAVPLRRALV